MLCKHEQFSKAISNKWGFLHPIPIMVCTFLKHPNFSRRRNSDLTNSKSSLAALLLPSNLFGGSEIKGNLNLVNNILDQL